MFSILLYSERTNERASERTNERASERASKWESSVSIVHGSAAEKKHEETKSHQFRTQLHFK